MVKNNLEEKNIYLDGEGFDGNYQTYMPAIIPFLEKNLDYQITIYATSKTINDIKINFTVLKNLKFIECKDYIKSSDNPLSFRNKQDSSMVKMIKDAKNNENAVIMSAGNSGAFILAIASNLKKLDPNCSFCFMSIFPTLDDSPKVVLDLGSNLNPTSDTLIAYAKQAILFNKIYFNYLDSKIYLLNNGKENWKGLKLHQETYQKLIANKKLNFKGNIEASEILYSDANIILSDSWTANAVLKAMEGTASFIIKEIKKSIKQASIIEKLAGLITKKTIKRFFGKFNYQSAGGSFILGCERICMKLHGASDTKAFYCGLERAKTAIENNLLKGMKKNYGN